MISLNPDNLLQFISPKIAEIDSKTTFVFGIRVSMCSGGSPGPWINNQATQAALFKHRLDVSISNATSDSGDVVIESYIFLKDPSATHRVHFISHIRQQLPNLPFFDLGIHRRSPQGDEVPHLVVRCGEKVVTQLSANLSAYFNGIQSTPLYLSRVNMMNTTSDEVKGIFDIHSRFLRKLQRINLSPHIIHIDRIRTEKQTTETPTIERLTRMWAASLQDDEGKSMQCDVESGSSDRQVYLLVPEHHAPKATLELKKYMDRLTNLHPSTVLNYTPSDEVITNVDFLRTMAKSNLWQTSPSDFPTPSTAQRSSNSNQSRSNPISQSQPNSRDDTSIGTAPSMKTSQPLLSKFNYARRLAMNDDQTVATTQPSLSATNISRFDEMEAEIQRHQAEFTSVHKRFDNVEDQALRTMAVCQASSKSLLDLRTESLKQLSELRTETAQSMTLLRDESAVNQRDLQEQLTSLLSIMTTFTQDMRSQSMSRVLSVAFPPKQPSKEDSTDTSSASSSSMSTSGNSQDNSLTDSPMDLAPSASMSATSKSISSPAHKKEKKKRTSTESKSTDQGSAQYEKPSAPDGPQS